LLDFVRRKHPASPEPSMLILSFDVPSAAWRRTLPHHQGSMLARAHIIQATSSLNYSCGSQDSGRFIQDIDLYIQQESNARINRARINVDTNKLTMKAKLTRAPVE